METHDTPKPGGERATQYRKKPIVISAVQWFPGKYVEGVTECVYGTPDGKTHSTNKGTINTLEGPQFVSPADWIITGVKGEKYPCKPDIFEATYEGVNGAPPPSPQNKVDGGQTMTTPLTPSQRDELGQLVRETYRQGSGLTCLWKELDPSSREDYCRIADALISRLRQPGLTIRVVDSESVNALQTEQAMHADWRKRAEEAEAREVRWRKALEGCYGWMGREPEFSSEYDDEENVKNAARGLLYPPSPQNLEQAVRLDSEAYICRDAALKELSPKEPAEPAKQEVVSDDDCRTYDPAGHAFADWWESVRDTWKRDFTLDGILRNAFDSGWEAAGGQKIGAPAAVSPGGEGRERYTVRESLELWGVWDGTEWKATFPTEAAACEYAALLNGREGERTAEPQVAVAGRQKTYEEICADKDSMAERIKQLKGQLAQANARIAELEQAIRKVVTQRGDDICWRDIYIELADLVGIDFCPQLVCDPEKFAANCKAFDNSMRTGGEYKPVFVEPAEQPEIDPTNHHNATALLRELRLDTARAAGMNPSPDGESPQWKEIWEHLHVILGRSTQSLTAEAARLLFAELERASNLASGANETETSS